MKIDKDFLKVVLFIIIATIIVILISEFVNRGVGVIAPIGINNALEVIYELETSL